MLTKQSSADDDAFEDTLFLSEALDLSFSPADSNLNLAEGFNGGRSKRSQALIHFISTIAGDEQIASRQSIEQIYKLIQ